MVATPSSSASVPPASPFVPGSVDATDFAQIEPYFRSLLDREIGSRPALERWILDRSDLSAACSEAKADLYITMTCNTDDKSVTASYLRYVEEVAPRLTPLAFELDNRLVELDAKFPMEPARYGVLIRGTKADVELYRPENVPIETQLAKLSQQYDAIQGAMTVQFEGIEQTPPQMARYQEFTDRSVRESAWRAVADRRALDVDAINAIYDEMITLRQQTGVNSGFPNYVGYAFKSKHRFDYGVEHCRQFHAGVEKAIVPFVRSLDRERQRLLGVDKLRPWDLSVDVRGRQPLKPFSGGKQLVEKTLVSLERLDPRLAQMFASMGTGAERVGRPVKGAPGSGSASVNFDLDSRKGKAPGGYQYMRDRSKRPFIFMNSAGLHKDVETMVHEAGHAFHSLLCLDEPLVEYRTAPMEFCEVASMAMELLTMRHWGPVQLNDTTSTHLLSDPFYTKQEDFRRACRQQLKRSTLILPWIATIDAFQHWVYSNPTHTRDQRSAEWLSLDARFGNAISWDGIEAFKPTIWQRQLHLFGSPFYYIEYGIAQLGALQLWLHSIEKGEASAIDHYMKALRLGGSKPLPELFAAAGLQFDFGPDIILRLVDRVAKELDKLPE